MTSTNRLRRGLLLALLVASIPGRAAADEIERAVMRVVTYAARADWNQPWVMHGVSSGTGTGFHVGGGRILTNAHVVADAREVQVWRFQDDTPYVARVEFVGHDCDLALLRVSDPRFLEGLPALRLAPGVPPARSRVRTYGYPMGGRELSNTDGVVSRYEYRTYAHDQATSLPAVQTDAAVNPGNSGGPVVMDGQVVGVAFQIMTGGQGLSYFIPIPVVRHFLDDVSDGRYDGFGSLGLRGSTLVSPAYRRFLRLPEGTTGVVVDGVYPGGPADGVLQPGDVILEAGGRAVHADGNVQVDGWRIAMRYELDVRQVGERLPLVVWRRGRAVELELPVRSFAAEDRLHRKYDTLPRYLVYAGLVFQPLDLEVFSTFQNHPKRLWWELGQRPDVQPLRPREETIVLSFVLPGSSNSQMNVWPGLVVEEVNGRPVRSLAELRDAFAAVTGPRHVIRFGSLDETFVEVMNVEAARAEHPRLLQTYGVPADARL